MLHNLLLKCGNVGLAVAQEYNFPSAAAASCRVGEYPAAMRQCRDCLFALLIYYFNVVECEQGKIPLCYLAQVAVALYVYCLAEIL